MKIIFLAITLLLTACVTQPTDHTGRKLSLADVGPPPSDINEVISNVLRYRLKDFDSAKIETPVKPRPVVFARATGLNTGGAGWEICPMVNAKNSFGAYTGFKPIFIFWKEGEVIDFNATEMAEFWCRDKNDARIETGQRLQ